MTTKGGGWTLIQVFVDMGIFFYTFFFKQQLKVVDDNTYFKLLFLYKLLQLSTTNTVYVNITYRCWCYHIRCPYVFISVWWCPLQFPHKKTIFGSSLHPVVCMMVHVLFAFVCVYWFVFCFACLRPVSCVPNFVSCSGLSIYWLPLQCSLTCIYKWEIFTLHLKFQDNKHIGYNNL